MRDVQTYLTNVRSEIPQDAEADGLRDERRGTRPAAGGLTALIGGCQFVVMDVPAALTAWLDFQEVPGDVAGLYAHDFTGKTKGEVLMVYAALEGKNAVEGRDWVSVE